MWRRRQQCRPGSWPLSGVVFGRVDAMVVFVSFEVRARGERVRVRLKLIEGNQ